MGSFSNFNPNVLHVHTYAIYVDVANIIVCYFISGQPSPRSANVYVTSCLSKSFATVRYAIDRYTKHRYTVIRCVLFILY